MFLTLTYKAYPAVCCYLLLGERILSLSICLMDFIVFPAFRFNKCYLLQSKNSVMWFVAVSIILLQGFNSLHTFEKLFLDVIVG